jgi:hypothetical protein
VIDELIAAERPLYSPTTTFIGARTWGPTDQGIAQSKMRAVETRNLAGTGGTANLEYGEFAVMFFWPLGRYGVRNHPQYLRKWHHLRRSLGLPLDGSRFTGATPTDAQAYINRVTALNPTLIPGAFELCTEDGLHEPTGPGQLYPYLEHRQIGR